MSGRKNVLLPYKFLDAQSLASSFNSEVITIQYLDNVGITLACSGVTDNTGEFFVECSIDGETWIDIEVSPQILLDDADDNILINLNNLPFSKVRLTFAPAGGTPNGVVTGYITAKEL